MVRRTFLQVLPCAAAAARAAAPARALIGMDTYSIRSLRWKAMQLLDYSARLGLNTIQISSLNEYESLEEAHLQKVKDHARRLGIYIDCGIGCVATTTASAPKNADPAKLLVDGLKVARFMGASAMRCFLGSPADRQGPLPIEAHIESSAKVFRGVRSQALDLGVKIAVENHGDFDAGEMKTLIEESGKDYVGVCLDTGNPMNLLEDPMFTVETLAPYCVTSHFRDSVLFETPRGAAFQWVALGDGTVGIDKLLRRFHELCPRAPVQLEIITGRPPTPVPYLEDGFWKAFPNKKASEFARYVALAKRGAPFMGAMMIGGPGKQPPEYEAALREQQRIDLERSLAFAKKVLWT